MQLTRFELQGFQSYRATCGLDIDPEITFLAGRNDVGKSALLRALKLFVERPEGIWPNFWVEFHWSIARDDLVNALAEGEKNEELLSRFQRAQMHTLIARFSLPGDSMTPHCAELRLPDATLSTGEIPYERQGGWESRPEAGPLGNNAVGVNSLIQSARAQAELVKAITPRRVDLEQRSLQVQREIAPDGRNLTDVLHTLRSNDLDAFGRLEEFIREAFPNVRQVTVALNEAQTSVMGGPALVYTDRPGQVPLRHCGSGIEQMLVLGLSVLTAPAGSLILIDEPQAYLHPHAERSLLALLDDHPEHQYVIATHSHQLLRSRPLRQARLVSLHSGASQIGQPSADVEVLEELDVTAADLWLSDVILWVEGPSEKAAFNALFDLIEEPERYSFVEVRPMPGNASRFAGRSERQAVAAYRFCEEVSRAISPLPVSMTFLFDTDEKPSEFQDTMLARSDGRALFLPCRELENLFLHPEAIHAALDRRCQQFELSAPGQAEVSKRLDEMLAAEDDRELFPVGGDPEMPAVARVRGAEVLKRMFWEFTNSQYDKVGDAPTLVRDTYVVAPSQLDPMRDVLAELAARDHRSGAEEQTD